MTMKPPWLYEDAEVVVASHLRTSELILLVFSKDKNNADSELYIMAICLDKSLSNSDNIVVSVCKVDDPPDGTVMFHWRERTCIETSQTSLKVRHPLPDLVFAWRSSSEGSIVDAAPVWFVIRTGRLLANVQRALEHDSFSINCRGGSRPFGYNFMPDSINNNRMV